MLIIALSLGAQETLRTRANALKSLAENAKPLTGAVFVAVGVMILFRFHHVLEAWAVRMLPIGLQDLSVAL